MAASTSYHPPVESRLDHRIELHAATPLLLHRWSKYILANSEYFFCPIPSAWCSFESASGDGPLPLGYLLLGWQNGILTDTCPYCYGKLLLRSFGESPLPSGNWAVGLCEICSRCSKVSSHPAVFQKRVKFVQAMRRQYPQRVEEWQEYDAHEFCWSGTALRKTRKRRLVTRELANPVALNVLVQEILVGKDTTNRPPTVSRLERPT